MLRSYCVTLDCWGGHKIVQETVQANDPKKAAQRAREYVQKKIKAPMDMVQVTNVEIVR